MQIKIPMAVPSVGEDEALAVYKAVLGKRLSMGKIVEEFENKIARYLGVEHALATSSGTSALHLAVKSAGLGEGDEVLVPDITFASTLMAVMYERAKPVICKVDPMTMNIDLDDCEKKITQSTKAILAVDMNGLPLDYSRVRDFCDKHGLLFIADSAEAFGAEYKKEKLGSQAMTHIFSFFPNKNLTTGEGGVLVTNDTDMFMRAKSLRSLGQSSRYYHECVGFNYRMTDIHASIGVEQIKKSDKILLEREKLAATYDDLFSSCKRLYLMPAPEYIHRHSNYSYTLLFENEADANRVQAALENNGIETRKSFPPMHNQKFISCYLSHAEKLDLEPSMRLWKRLLNLPIWPGLKTDQQEYIAKIVDSIL